MIPWWANVGFLCVACRESNSLGNNLTCKLGRYTSVIHKSACDSWRTAYEEFAKMLNLSP